MVLFVICATEYFVRFLRDSPVRKYTTPMSEEKRDAKLYEWSTLKYLVFALAVETVFLFIRLAHFSVLFTTVYSRITQFGVPCHRIGRWLVWSDYFYRSLF